MIISLVVAVARNGVIGDVGTMPWRMPSDLKYFKRVTMGKPVVMGRKTFESIGRPLPGRPNIVVTRSGDFAADGVVIAGSVEEGLDEAARLASDLAVEEVMVIGGGEIYRQSLDRAHRVYLTELSLDVNGDTRFPDLDDDLWREVSRESFQAGEGDSADYAFVVYERRKLSGG